MTAVTLANVHVDTYCAHMDTYSARVAAAVATAIEKGGHTVLGISESTGIPRATLTRRLAGHTPFTVAELEAIARSLGVDVRTFTADAA